MPNQAAVWAETDRKIAAEMDSEDTEINTEDDEDDSSDSGDDRVRYNPETDEKFPIMPAYHSSFKKSEDKATGIVEHLRQTVKSSSYKGRVADILLKKMDDKCSPKYESNFRVALLGDSGTGKSSLINSLLHEESIAAKVSCTEISNALIYSGLG